MQAVERERKEEEERETRGEEEGGSKGREAARGSLLLCLCCQKDSDERERIAISGRLAAPLLCSPRSARQTDPVSERASDWTASLICLIGPPETVSPSQAAVPPPTTDPFGFGSCLLNFYLILTLLTQKERERGRGREGESEQAREAAVFGNGSRLLIEDRLTVQNTGETLSQFSPPPPSSSSSSFS